MASFNGETDDADYDDSLFPAYTDYINGVDTGWHEAHEPGFNDLPYQYLAPILYTNSMPTRPISNEPTNTVPAGFVLDLRSPPVHPDMVKLIGPETLHPTPPSRRIPPSGTPYGGQHERPVFSAEITKQKLTGASVQQSTGVLMQSPLYQAPHDLAGQLLRNASPGPRRVPGRNATHSSLLRSSSATDIDNQAGAMPPSRSGMVKFEHPPSPADSGVYLLDQQVPQRYLGRQPNPAVQQPGQLAQPHDLAQFSPIALLLPGELLNDPRYAAAPLAKRQEMYGQITELYSIVNHHPDPELRKHAHLNIAQNSAAVRRMVQNREEATRRRLMEEAAQRHVQPDMQRSHARLPEMENSFSVPQDFSAGYEQPTLSSQHQSYAIAIPHEQQQPQQVPQPHGNGLQGYSHTPAHFSYHDPVIDAQVMQYVLADRHIHNSATDARSRELAIHWQNSLRVALPPGGLRYLDQEVAKMHHGQNSHQPVQPHLSVQEHHPNDLAQPDQPIQNLAQQYHANKSSQAWIPHIAVSGALQQHIHSNLRQLCNAMRICGLPPTHENAEMQQKAREFLRDFKASLPADGHAYIEGLVNKMRMERAEGRNPWNAMPAYDGPVRGGLAEVIEGDA
jgi:hypothetical protein